MSRMTAGLGALMFVLLMLNSNQAAAQSNADQLPPEAGFVSSLPVQFFGDTQGLSRDQVAVFRVTLVEWTASTSCFVRDASACDFFGPGDGGMIVWVGGGASAGFLVTVAGGLAWGFDGPAGSIPVDLTLLEDVFVSAVGLPASGSGGLAGVSGGPETMRAMGAASVAAVASTLLLVGWRRHARG